MIPTETTVATETVVPGVDVIDITKKQPFVASAMQQAIFDWISTGVGNALIQAVAGSGKTTTLIESLKLMSGSVAFCAYSKRIADEIEVKVGEIAESITARIHMGTMHRFGRKTLVQFMQSRGASAEAFKPKPTEKINRILDETPYGCGLNEKTGRHDASKENGMVGVPIHLRGFVAKAYDLARQWGAGFLFTNQHGWTPWMQLVERFDLRDEFANEDGDLPADVDELVKEGCKWTAWAINYGVIIIPEIIDYEDMIYATLRLNLRVWQYDWVLVDECQDVNPTRLALAKKMLKAGGRLVAVGDRHQAIFGFTGADSSSVDNIIKAFNCKELPLTVSFRCPQTVVTFAQQWVKHIQSAPAAKMGTVTSIDSSVLMNQNLIAADAILCRNNAPLIDLFFSLLRKGIASHIEGRDIAKGLKKLVNRWKSVKNIPALETKLIDYKEREIQKAQAKGQEQKAEQIADMVDAVLAIIDHLPDSAVLADLRNKIDSMFMDTDGNAAKTLTLTTIHKAKGREWNRVFWYGRNRWNPSPYARQDWQIEQENNLCYVAATRSKDTLVDVIVPVPARRIRRY